MMTVGNLSHMRWPIKAGLALALVLVAGAAWADWPMFRLDAVHSGIIPDGSLGELTEQWATLLGDSVDSSPAVSGGVVYVGTSEGDMCAVSAGDGAEIWRYRTGGAIVSSPAVVGGLVLFGSVDRFLYAVNAATGQLAWKYRTYGSIIASPACDEGVVYFGSIGGRVYACSIADGRVIWRSGKGSAIQASPAVAGGLVFCGDEEGKLRALRAADGTQVWEYQASGKVVAGPVVGDEVVIFLIMSPTQLRPPKIDHIIALRRDSGEKVWAQNEARSVLSTPVIAGDRVYFVTVEGYLSQTMVRAASVHDGSELWEKRRKTRGRAVGGVVDSSPILVGDKLCFGCHDGNLYVIDTAEGDVVRKVPLAQKVYSSPAFSDGRIYIGADDGKLHCLE